MSLKTTLTTLLALALTSSALAAPPDLTKRASETIYLSNCVTTGAAYSKSGMFYYSASEDSQNGASPSSGNYATVNGGSLVGWEGATVSGTFGSGVTFTSKIEGGAHAAYSYSGSGSNGSQMPAPNPNTHPKPKPKPNNNNNNTSYSMHPSLHEAVRQRLLDTNLTLTFHATDSPAGSTHEYDTSIMGRFVCPNRACNTRGWTSKKVAITIRMYPGGEYNARVYHQRCRSCHRLARPVLDASMVGLKTVANGEYTE
ncbi:3CxxC-type zinc finger protein [Aspergillus candidus]|uniref:Zinc-binding domain-domain-containing protein n=1 Tax=Aspergillus candidus TaxID=41067 RepID=A0A2I2FPV1_ASPCN|nr:zinc-binding domain-domain-containing protein [Aspergillus candidus]PLB42673.1 zinc-binding domain-domain-containing protein [Aspergillus candidus]